MLDSDIRLIVKMHRPDDHRGDVDKGVAPDLVWKICPDKPFRPGGNFRLADLRSLAGEAPEKSSVCRQTDGVLNRD